MEPGDGSHSALISSRIGLGTWATKVGLGRRAGPVYRDYIDIYQAVTDPVGPGFMVPPAPPGGPMLASRHSSRRGQTVVP